MNPSSLTIAAMAEVGRHYSFLQLERVEELPVPKTIQTGLMSTRIVKWEDEYKTLRQICAKLFGDLGCNYIVAGGYAAYRAGLTRCHTDIDFFTVVEQSSENMCKIEEAVKSFDREGYRAHFKVNNTYLGICVCVTEVQSAKSADMVFRWAMFEDAKSCQQDSLKMSKFITDEFDIPVCKVVGIPCFSHYLAILIVGTDIGKSFNSTDVALVRNILAHCHTTLHVLTFLGENCTRHPLFSIIKRGIGNISSLRRSLERFLKYEARTLGSRMHLSSDRVMCMIDDGYRSVLNYKTF